MVARHFIQNNTFYELGVNSQLEYIFPESGHPRISQIDSGAIKIPDNHIRLPIIQSRQKIWKWLYLIDQLRWKPGAQAKSLRKLHRANAGKKATFILTLLGLPVIRHIYKKFSHKKLNSEPNLALRNYLKKEKPDFIIHPCVLEGLFINDLIVESNDLKIPLIAIMNSWDNPSTKRAMIGTPDWLLVWGEQTYRHAIEYANMPPDRTIKFGAAQFEAHRGKPRLSKSEFCRANKIREDLPILVYAGSSKGTREIDHLTHLDRGIESGILPKMSIIYRPHPWGGGGEGGKNILSRNWKHVAVDYTMREYLKKISLGEKDIMGLTDYRNTHEILSHCDALLSPLSTIILESWMHGKPALCLLPQEDQSQHFINDSRLTHFQDLFKMAELVISRGKVDLIPKTKELMDMTRVTELGKRLRQSSEYFVSMNNEPYGKRLHDFIKSSVVDKKT